MSPVRPLEVLILNLRGQKVLLDAEVVANCDHLSRLKPSPSLPYVFTEHGALMAAKERWLQPASPRHHRRLKPALHSTSSR